MTNYYGTDAGARSLCGHPTPEEISNPDMEALLLIGTQRVKDDTARTDWSAANSQWNLVNQAAEIVAAKFAVLRLTSIDKPSDRIRDLERLYDEIIQTINNALPDPGETSPAFNMFVAAYQTYPLNPDATTYESVL